MAINRGVLGSQTGSMGGITASNWKGRNVYKQKVPATNSSNTPAQAAQRRKFAALAALSGLIGPAIRLGFNSSAASITEQNAFVKANFGAVTDDGTMSTIDYSMLKVSAGIVAPVVGLDFTYTSASGNVQFDWTDNSNGGDALPTDLAYLLVINTATGQVYTDYSGSMRSDAGGGTANIPAGLLPANLRGYVFFKRATNTSTSPSVGVVAHA